MVQRGVVARGAERDAAAGRTPPHGLARREAIEATVGARARFTRESATRSREARRGVGEGGHRGRGG